VQEGLDAAGKALQIHARMAEAYAIRGKLYQLLQNQQLASEALSRAFELNPSLKSDYR
jgi:hypothetical protein